MSRPSNLPRTCVLTLSLGASVGFACADEPVEIPESLYGEPVCMVALSFGHYEDGSRDTIIDMKAGLAPAGCACLPLDDRYSWPKDDLDMLAELALVECERMAEALYDFDWNDCQADFEAEAWYMHVFPVAPPDAWDVYLPDDLHCIPEP